MNFHINDFEGPLDLLLHLINQEKMNIYDIEISQIIEQYLNIIKQMQDLNIDFASTYLVMAAELLHLKSKLLLNIEDTEDNEEYEFATEEDLKNKLIEYQLYKDVTEDLKILKEKRNEIFTKDPTNISEYNEEKIMANENLTLEDLLNAFLEMQKREELSKPINTKIAHKELSVGERIVSIRKMLARQTKINFRDLFESFTKDYIVVTFLSILDMSKNKEVFLYQENNFDNILIEKRV